MDRNRTIGRGRSGFSLLELLTAIAITGILLSLALPSFYHQLQTNRIRTHINGIVAGLHIARAEAIRRNGTVMVCESRDLDSCTGGADWSRGWIVFADANRNNRRDQHEPMLHVYSSASPGIRIDFNGAGRNGDRWLHYRATGSSKNGTFTVCDRRGAADARAVILYRSGRPRVSTRTASGKPLRCRT
jgi:type IV fimbrial biogenesis protein FimT